MRISVIIPVYNAEQYLHRSLDSIIAQSFTDWECIIVDDGSTDKSGSICDEYVSKDSRFHVIHKQNEGVSKARNLGIQKSKGDYIAFLDADDWVDKEYFGHLAENSYADLVVSGYESHGTVELIREPKTNSVVRIVDIASYLNIYNKEEVSWVFVWGKLFKSEIIRNNSISFNTEMRYLEDCCFVLDYISCIETLYLLKKHEIHHIVEEGKFSKYYMNYRQLQTHMVLQIQSFDRLEQLCQSSLENMKTRISILHYRCFRRYLVYGKDTIKDRIKQLKIFCEHKNDDIFRWINYTHLEKFFFMVACSLFSLVNLFFINNREK